MVPKEISVLLRSAQEGNQTARDSLFAELVTQLRVHAKGLMKNERADHTLQATALVNEACLKLMQEGVVDSAQNRRQLFHAATRAMRQVLIDHARSKATQKRGGDYARQPIDVILDQFESKHKLSFLDLDVALERLQQESPREFETLSLRFFAGLTIAETAELLGCSAGTVESDWRFARAKLLVWLQEIA
ncbi:MAG: ECF-type sigma factor [Planctomycetaceae bacterium]